MSQMRIIKLDARQWKTPLDFYDALLSALEAPEWHGRSINALIDSLWFGEISTQ
jgi:RNAse (barnase) inhibitor barstar